MQLYCTINKVNGKLYIGKDCKEDPNYIGSGKILRMAIKKYGKENFVKVILEDSFPDERTLCEREKYWIKMLRAQDRRIGYNIADGGEGYNNRGRERGIEWRKKTSISVQKLWETSRSKIIMSEQLKSLWKDKEYIQRVESGYNKRREQAKRVLESIFPSLEEIRCCILSLDRQHSRKVSLSEVADYFTLKYNTMKYGIQLLYGTTFTLIRKGIVAEKRRKKTKEEKSIICRNNAMKLFEDPYKFERWKKSLRDSWALRRGVSCAIQ